MLQNATQTHVWKENHLESVMAMQVAIMMESP